MRKSILFCEDEDIHYHGEDIQYNIDISFEDSILGKTETITLPIMESFTNYTNIDETEFKEKIKIPRGVDTGMTLKEQYHFEKITGNLYVHINVKPHPFFKRDGKDIYCVIQITPEQAELGAKIELPTLKGNVELEIPKGIRS